MNVNEEIWIRANVESIFIGKETIYRVKIPNYGHINQHDGQEYVYVDVNKKDTNVGY